MFDRFTDRARKVMALARQEAERFNHDHIETGHILLGLLKEDTGTAAIVLKNLDVNLEALRLEVEKSVKPRTDVIAMGQMPYTPRAKKVVEYAVEEAKNLKHNYVGTEHLLLGLLREKEGVAAEALMNLKLDVEKVRIKVMEFLGSDGNSPVHSAYNLSSHLETLLARRDLTSEAATEVSEAIVAGRVGGPSLAALLMALRAKGESVAEIAAFAKVLRASAVPVQAPAGTLDTCGTGGDRSGTFNISTAAALCAAGMGIPVAKHGGRSVSSQAGSADVLKVLGVKTDAAPACTERCIREAGIGFIFAPAHHPGMKHVAPVRKELGVRTIFNLLGPLANPAGAKLQLVGVCEPAWCEKLAKVLALLGGESAMVVCGAGSGGADHLDEISTFGPTKIARLENGRVELEEAKPEALGFEIPPPDALRAGNAAESAEIITRVLNGEKGPPRDIVLLNAAAAALVAHKAADWKNGLRLAAESVDSGKALAALKKLVVCSNQ